ncbi:MAG: methylated-DNA--[protein]-cysteine S-methyltransferase [Deltaproteobacteria bacterium]|nr:methylated-DNA--[protein]-cysteine S-methyltransferase [Deltaproteobacteria bacterium]
MSLVQKIVLSPVGPLRLVASDVALLGVYFRSHRRAPPLAAREVEEHEVLDHTASELAGYFRGERRRFSTPLSAVGTDFQRAVWTALARIPYGERRSYSELAHEIGRPRAIRAVGMANALNPLSIFVPCHRVVRTTGELSGYAGGVSVKEWLLAHEQRFANKQGE